MTDYFRATLVGGDDPRAMLESLLRNRWTRDIVVTESDRKDPYHRDLEIRVTQKDMIVDGTTGGRTFFVTVGKPAGIISASPGPQGRWSFRGPPQQQFFSEFRRVNTALVERSENLVLEVAHEKIVEAPLVQQALSPIRNIIVWLDQNGRASWETLRGLGKSEAQIRRYLSLLEAVDYARPEGSAWVPGARFPTGTSHDDPKTFYDRMLGNVVRAGFDYMREVVRLTQVVGYFFWSNTYFLTALEADQRVALRQDDLAERKARYYPSRRQAPIEVIGQVQRVIDTKLLIRQSGGIIGDEQKTEAYLTAAKTAGLNFVS